MKLKIYNFDLLSYPHVLLEHLEGPTLRRLLRREGKLPLEQVLPLALPLVELILHMLAREPEERPRAGEVATALEPLVAVLASSGKSRRRHSPH